MNSLNNLCLTKILKSFSSFKICLHINKMSNFEFKKKSHKFIYEKIVLFTKVNKTIVNNKHEIHSIG